MWRQEYHRLQSPADAGNIERIGVINMSATLQDATVFDPESVERADILLADVPCSGLGVIGKKADIRYKMTPAKQTEIIKLQRKDPRSGSMSKWAEH